MSRLQTFLLSNFNCLTSAPRAGQPKAFVVPHMRASPSHDDRGDAASAAAAPDIKAPASFTDSGGGDSQAAGEDQAGGDLLIHDNLQDQQLRAAKTGRSAQANDADPLFHASIQWNASNRLDASAGHKLQPQPQQLHQKQKQQQQQQQQRQQPQQSQQSHHQQDREQQQQLPQPQQQQQHPKQQHLPLDMRESGEGTEEDGQEGESERANSSNSNSDDEGMVVTSVVIGDPSRLQEQHGSKQGKANKASVAVEGHLDVDYAAIKKDFNWSLTHGNGEIMPTYGNRDHRQESIIQSYLRRFPILSQHINRNRPSSGRGFVPVMYPAMRHRVRDIGIRVSFVQTPELRTQCLRFCQENVSLSIDTEAAPLNRNIDLLQIGNGDEVFLCPLRDQDPRFLNAVAAAIFQDVRKTVYQFGSDDATKFLRAIDNRMGIACTVVDVQERLRKQEQLPVGLSPSLANAVLKSRYGSRILSKAWTISGWDNIPLHPDQAEYAALDALFTFLLGSDMN